MIDVGVRRRQPRSAIEAPAPLHVHQDGAYEGQGGPFAAEKELVEISGFAEYLKVLLADVPGPCAANKIGDQRVELAEIVGHAGAKLDKVAISVRPLTDNPFRINRSRGG